MTKLSSKREKWIDVCRAIAIILVLLGHNNPPFIKYIFGFHVPMFFLISGYLYKDVQAGDEIKYLKKTFTRYFAPYYILSLVNLVIRVLMIKFLQPDYTFSAKEIWDYVIAIVYVAPDHMPGCGPMWFLPSLAAALLIFMMLRKIRIKVVYYTLIVCMALISIVLSGKGQFVQIGEWNEFLPLRLHASLLGVVFLQIGLLIKKYNLIKKIDTKSVFVRIIVIVVTLVLGTLTIRVNNVNPWIDMNNARYGNAILMILGAVLMTLAIMMVCNVGEKSLQKIYSPMQILGKHTIIILAFDEASNAIGGIAIGYLHLPFEWYTAFAVRITILAVMVVIWQLLIRMTGNKKIMNFLNW